MIIILVLILFALRAVLGFVCLFFSSDFFKDSQLTVLEAGYEGLQLGLPMRSSFFSLVALFVLFDLELVFLFPGILFGLFSDAIIIWILVVFVVIITLVLEWVWYGLKWQI